LYNRDGVCLLRGTDWIFMCFVWISEQTAIISLYDINWLVCITETECVHCAVRTGCLNTIQFKFSVPNAAAPWPVLLNQWQFIIFSQYLSDILRDAAWWPVHSTVSSMKRLDRQAAWHCWPLGCGGVV